MNGVAAAATTRPAPFGPGGRVVAVRRQARVTLTTGCADTVVGGHRRRVLR